MKALFLKSGVPYGYGYAAGESGTVSADDVPALTSAGVIQIVEDAEAPKKEKATNKTTTEKR